MPIEFSCTQCGSTLRVAVEYAGKQARCPSCKNVSQVPDVVPSGVPLTAPVSPAPKAAPQSTPNPFGNSTQDWNPYQSPRVSVDYLSKVAPAPLGHATADLGTIFNYSFELWKTHLGLLVGMTLTVFAIQIAVSMGLGGLNFAIEQMAPDSRQLVEALGNILGNLLGLYLGIGQSQLLLKLARNQPASIGDVFGGGERFLPTLGRTILFGLAVGVGFVLLIVPGIIVLLVYWPSYWLVVDNRSPVMESFERAAVISKNNRLTTLALAVSVFGINLLGCLALGIGLLFSVPLGATLWAVAYLMMSGQIPAGPAGSNPFYAK